MKMERQFKLAAPGALAGSLSVRPTWWRSSGRARRSTGRRGPVSGRPPPSAALRADRSGPARTVSTHRENLADGVWAALDIATNGGTATVCLTTALDDVTSTAPEQVDSAMQAFERIMGAAMPVEDSLDCLRRHEGQWKDKI